MKRFTVLVVLLFVGFALYAQDDFNGFKLTKAPTTSYIEERSGKSFELEFVYLYAGASANDWDLSMNIFGINPVLSKWNGKFGLTGSFPFTYIDTQIEGEGDIESAGFSFAPSLGMVFKVTGDLQESHLLAFGGLTVVPANFLWIWEDDVFGLDIYMPSIGFTGGLKGMILLSEDFTLIPFGMLQFTKAWIDFTYNDYNDGDSLDLIVSPAFGLDVLYKGYSLGAMLDFAENTTTFQLHFRIPISREYDDE